MKKSSLNQTTIAGRDVEYRVVHSKQAKKLRIRVGINGIEVVQPVGRNGDEVADFLQENANWVVEQLDRIESFRNIRKPEKSSNREILFRGEQTPVTVECHSHRGGQNQIKHDANGITIINTANSVTPPARSLENWLRKQARTELLSELDVATSKIKRKPGKVFVMGQRTKWGNCSSLQNISFNWRLIMAPAFVLQYLVTHEAVHLAIPDHSQKFWLTVQSMCPETERARRWLSANSHRLLEDLSDVCGTL